MTSGRRPLTAHLEPDAAALTCALSSLGRSFTPAGRARADVLALGGAGDWTARAREAIAAGVRGLLVLGPAPAAAGVLRELAEASRLGAVPVVLARPWAEPALVARLRRSIDPDAGPALLVQSTACGPADERTLLAEQAGVLRGIASGPPAPARVRTGADGYIGHLPLRLGAVTVSAAVTGIRSTRLAPRLTVRVHWDAGVLRAQAGAPGSAQPWHLAVATASGELSRPAEYESGYRRSWLRLRAAIDAPAAAGEELSAFAGDCSVVAQALGPAEGPPAREEDR